MVGVFAKSPGRRAATPRRSKHFLEDRVGIKRISPASGLQSDKFFDSFEPAKEPEDPLEIDQPISCPDPEPSIMEDGMLWKARILASLQRRNDILTAAKERQLVFRGGSFQSSRTQYRSKEKILFVAHSAPEYEMRKLLE